MSRANKVIIKIILFGTVLCTLTAKTIAQQIDATIETYADQFSQERIYLHFDKSSYTSGETIWFKAYMVDATLPAYASKTLYLDWIDNKGNTLSHDAFPLVDGICNGQYIIPPEYTGKSIHVKSYTKWMMNFDPDFYFNKDIPIISSLPEKITSASPIPSITFFPEGGDLIAGLTCKIAFKVNDQWGRPINLEGQIIDMENKPVATFKTMHDGMGFFFLSPKSNTSYSARWKDQTGLEHTSDLPDVKEAGIALQITLKDNERVMQVSFSENTVKEIGHVHIIGTMFQKTVFKLYDSIDGASIKKIIPIDSLPQGILTITVFDQQWKPLAERITFVKKKNAFFETKFEIKQKGLDSRGKNIFQIIAPDNIATSLSIAVTDNLIGSDESTNIFSYLSLNSELKGNVYNSAYYFSSDEDSVAMHLDLVMLTHGWRRFIWEDVVKGKFPKIEFARDTNYLSLSGAIIGVSPAQIRRTKQIYILVKSKDGGIKMTEIPLQSDGSFNDPRQIIFDTVYLNHSFPKRYTLPHASVLFTDQRIPANTFSGQENLNTLHDTTGYWWHSLLADQARGFNEKSEGKVLKEVVVKTTRKTALQTMDEKYTSGMFRGGDNYQFDIINDPLAISSTDIFTYLTAKVPGLLVNRDGNHSYLSWRGGSPMFYIDETRVSDSTLGGMSLSNIAYLKIFRPPFAGAPFGGTFGAIAIYTKRGDDVVPSGNKENIMVGYTAIRQFYTPNYETPDASTVQQDVRTTLYWNPNITTAPGNNQSTFTFYGNDVTKAFRVVIEGISRDGRLTHQTVIVK